MILAQVVAGFTSRRWRELGRFFRNHQWERNDDGEILIANAKIGGIFSFNANDGRGEVLQPNLVTTEGCNYLLATGIGAGSQSTVFYIAPFSGNVSIVDTLTAATFASTVTELTTQYSEATRPVFTESVPANKALDNTANPALITAAVTNVSVWGAGILSASAKGATTGVCLAAAKYTTARTLPSIGDTLGIKYSLTLSNV